MMAVRFAVKILGMEKLYEEVCAIFTADYGRKRRNLKGCIRILYTNTGLYALAVKEYWFIMHYLYHLILGLSLWLSLVISQSQLLEFILSFQYV